MAFGERGHADFQHTLCMTIDPAAAFGSDFEGGRYVQQSPGVVKLHEEPLAMGTEQAEVAMGGGQEPVDADMALGDHRMEHTGHPDSGGERGFVWGERAPGAKNVCMGTQHLQFLGFQHDVPAAAREEGQQTAIGVALGMATLGAEHRVDFGLGEFERFQQRRSAEQIGCRSLAQWQGRTTRRAARLPAAPGLDPRRRGRRRTLAAGWSASNHPKKPRSMRAPGSSRTGAS